MCFKFSKCNYARTSSCLPCYNRDREPAMDQNGGKNIAFPTALLVIRILCIPELVSQLDIKWVIKSTLNYPDFPIIQTCFSGPHQIQDLWLLFINFLCPKDQLRCDKTLLTTLILPPLTSVCIFSILFSIHFQRGWQGEFV